MDLPPLQSRVDSELQAEGDSFKAALSKKHKKTKWTFKDQKSQVKDTPK